MAIWKIIVEKSFGGRSNRFKWSNSYFIESAITDITSDVLRTSVMDIVEAERSAHLETVHFIAAYVKQQADNTYNAPDGTGKRIILEGVGDRVAATPALPIEVVLEVTKEADYGRSGTLKYRGCLMQSDVQVGADNTYILGTPATFSTGGVGEDTIVEKLNGDLPGGSFCLPEKAGLLIQSAREVTLHRLAGVGILKTGRNRRTVEADEIATAQRELNTIGGKITRLAKRAPQNILNGEFLALALDLAAAAWAIYTVLPTPQRAALRMPARILALMPSP